MQDFAVLKKKDLVTMLVEMGENTEVAATMSKKQLVEEISKKSAHSVILTTPLETVVQSQIDSNVSEKELDIKSIIPNIGDPDWTKYVLSLFHKDELINGNPSCDGLRRVFETLIGIIISVDMEVIQCPDTNNLNRATVKCTIKYYNNKGSFDVSDVADSCETNTDFPYNKYPVATAATLAEGRALRKTMRIRTLTSEEISKEVSNNTASQSDFTKIADNQKLVLTNLVNELDIDLSKLLENKPIEEISYVQAQDYLRKLNLYSRGPLSGGESVPDNLLKRKLGNNDSV
jgi:hypothetical protein